MNTSRLSAYYLRFSSSTTQSCYQNCVKSLFLIYPTFIELVCWEVLGKHTSILEKACPLGRWQLFSGGEGRGLQGDMPGADGRIVCLWEHAELSQAAKPTGKRFCALTTHPHLAAGPQKSDASFALCGQRSGHSCAHKHLHPVPHFLQIFFLK